VVAAVLGTVATLCSPVAGLFIEVLAAAVFLAGQRRRAYLLAAGPAVVVGATTLLFPFSGIQPLGAVKQTVPSYRFLSLCRRR
jgi:hypothetical protein